MTPAGTVLATARFTLTPLAETDRHDLFAHLADPETVEYMDIEPLSDLAGADAIIAWAVRLLRAQEGVRWAIRGFAGGFVGTAGFNALVHERGSRGELAYDVVRARRRQGVMAEVLPAILAYGHDDTGLRRIEALVTPGNAPSAALLERFGFSREATLRDYGFWKGRFWDQWLYARIATTPVRVRTAHRPDGRATGASAAMSARPTCGATRCFSGRASSDPLPISWAA